MNNPDRVVGCLFCLLLGVTGCGLMGAPECEPVRGSVATFEPTTEGCFLYSGGLDRVEGEFVSTAGICNTCDSRASAWLTLLGVKNINRAYRQASRGDANILWYPFLLAENAEATTVFDCDLNMNAVPHDIVHGPVEFPPGGHLDTALQFGWSLRDDCTSRDCPRSESGDAVDFDAERLVHVWPHPDREPSVHLSDVCSEAQAGGDVRALIEPHPYVRVDMDLEPTLSTELEETTFETPAPASNSLDGM